MKLIPVLKGEAEGCRVQGHPLNIVCCEACFCCKRPCLQKEDNGKLLVHMVGDFSWIKWSVSGSLFALHGNNCTLSLSGEECWVTG